MQGGGGEVVIRWKMAELEKWLNLKGSLQAPKTQGQYRDTLSFTVSTPNTNLYLLHLDLPQQLARVEVFPDAIVRCSASLALDGLPKTYMLAEVESGTLPGRCSAESDNPGELLLSLINISRVVLHRVAIQ